jgi:predicted neuraminidase
LIRSGPIFTLDGRPTPECHAATLAETPSGLVAAWFGGTEEKDPDVGIYVAHLEPGGWSRPARVADGVQHDRLRYPCWNPVLFQVPGGPLLLFYKVGPDPERWWGMRIQSADGGWTWSEPCRLPEGVLGPIKNKPLLLDDGTLLCGSSTEEQGWRVHFERSSDLGRTWSITPPLNDGRSLGAIQPALLRGRDGSIHALGLTQQGRVFETTSLDGGRTWTPLTLGKLPNPNSGLDAVTLPDGRQLIVYNHTPRGRSPLNVALSDDLKRWDAALVLEDAPGEYSYPAVIAARDGLVHVAYTHNRQVIQHAVIDPAQLQRRPILDGRWPD